MGQLAFGVAGAVAGGFLGGPVGAQIGFAAGSIAGALLFPPKGPTVEGPRLTDKTVQASTYGIPIPWVWGIYRLAGNAIWATDIVEVRSEEEVGGKGGPSATQVNYSYFGNFAVALCKGPIEGIGRIWADGKVIYGEGSLSKYNDYITVYLGTDDQLPDPTMEADKGVGNVPAYRGTAYIVFANLPLADFGNRIPIIHVEVIAHNLDLQYDSGVVWWSSYAAANSIGDPYRARITQLDKYGNLILQQDGVGLHNVAWTQDAGSIVWDLQAGDLADMVDAWAGSAVVDRGTGYEADKRLYIAPICGGEYLIAGFRAGHSMSDFAHWICILEPSQSGPPTLLGAVFTANLGLTADSGNFVYCETGKKTANDPLISLTNYAVNFSVFAINVFPSATDIISGRYNAGWPGYAAYEIPTARLNPVGNSALLAYIYEAGYPNLQHGFTLPAGTGSATNLYFYLNRAFLDYQAGSPAHNNTEIRNTIQPAYPNGAMIKIELGLIDYATIAAAGGGTISGYTIDNNNWVLSDGTAAIPFADEYTYLSTGASGGTDAYQMQPAMLQARADGSWLVGFTMPGVDDSTDNLGGDDLWMAARLFVYNPITEKATQLGRVAGHLYNRSDIGNPGFPTLPDYQQLLSIENDQIYVYGYVTENKIAYKAKIGDAGANGYVTLDIIVGDICEGGRLVDGTDFDVDPLAASRVPGHMVGREVTCRTAIQQLMPLYSFYGVESDGKIKFNYLTGVPIATVDEDLLAAQEGEGEPAPKVTERRKQDYELPSRVVLKYADRNLDYQQGTQQERRISGAINAGDPASIEVATVLDPDTAKQIAQKNLFNAWMERAGIESTLPPEYIIYDSGDCLTVEWDGMSAPIRFGKYDFGANGIIQFDGVATDSIIYLDSPATGVTPETPGQEVPLLETMTLDIIDGPLLRDQDDAPGEYVSGSGQTSDWRGGIAYRSADDSDFSEAARFVVPAVRGAARSVLGAATYGACLFDRTNTVRVELSRTDLTLASASEEDVLSGTNAAMLGDELIGFATATLVRPGTYDLSNLLRYRQGTEWATHAYGERFVLLKTDGSTQSVSRILGDLGKTDYWRGVSFGGTIDSVSSQTATFGSNRLKPIAPIKITGTRDAFGHLNITWTPRARTNVDIIDGADTGVDEEIEAYDVEIYDGAELVNTLHTNKPAVLYTLEQQIADFGSPFPSSVSVIVYQLSTRVGRGYPGSATV